MRQLAQRFTVIPRAVVGLQVGSQESQRTEVPTLHLLETRWTEGVLFSEQSRDPSTPLNTMTYTNVDQGITTFNKQLEP